MSVYNSVYVKYRNIIIAIFKTHIASQVFLTLCKPNVNIWVVICEAVQETNTWYYCKSQSINFRSRFLALQLSWHYSILFRLTFGTRRGTHRPICQPIAGHKTQSGNHAQSHSRAETPTQNLRIVLPICEPLFHCAAFAIKSHLLWSFLIVLCWGGIV